MQNVSFVYHGFHRKWLFTDSLTLKMLLPYGHEFMKIQYKPGRMANQKYQNIAHHDCRQAVFRSGVIFLLLGFAHFHGRRWSDSNEVVWAPLLLLDEVIVEVAIVFVPVVSTFMSLQEASWLFSARKRKLSYRLTVLPNIKIWNLERCTNLS